MKKYFLTVMLLALGFCTNVTAQDGSHAFLKEGKVWNCVLQYGPDGNTEYYKNIIRGDSVVNGITYFKMYRETDTVSELDFYALWREDEGKVYTFVPSEGKERLMYDFSAQPESEVFCEGKNRQVKAVGKVTVGEQSFNCLSILVSDGFLITWVEGIGSPYGPGYPIGPMLSNGKITELLSCYEDGRLIFESTDFNKAFKADVKINEANFPDENFRNWVLSAAVDKNKNRILDDDEIQRVTDIDVHQKKIASLKGIEFFTELHILTCYQNPLTELDLSKNTKLDTLNCAWDKLTSLNVKNCAKLKWIRCDSNKLTELDLSGCMELKLLVCSGNNISALDVSACTKLDYFDCGGNNLTALDLSNNTELTTLSCGMNHLVTLDLSNNTKLMVCSCTGNAMIRLILSKDNVLNSLECSTNQLYGAAMEHIVENLNYQQKGGFLCVFNAENKELEKNVITTTQVAALNAKGWKVYQWIYSEYSIYLGSEPKDDYHPLIEEGKHWTYDNYMPLRPSEYDHYYYYDLRGDTLIAGQQCLKMYSENLMNNSEIKYQGSLFEENKKVYYFSPGKEKAELLYDFDCFMGDTLHVRAGDLVVKDIQTEDNGGIAIKRYTLYETNDMLDISWIEGVGASTDFFGMMPYPGNYNTLNACELNGEKLYQTIKKDPTEEGYHKMGIEGKRWNYIHYYIDNDGEHFDPYWYVVKGDTIIRRTNYKILYYQDEKTERPVCLLREVGREVFKCDFGDNSYDTPLGTSFFHFGRDDFGRVFSWKAKMEAGNTNWMVYNVDTIKVNNRFFRRYTCLQKYSEEEQALTTIEDGDGVWHDIWVEGIGSASSGIEDQNPNHEPPVRTTSDYTYFVSCYENGDCIFTADDFNVQGTGIETIINNKVETRPSIYNIQGQRLNSLQKGLNIVNGQKIFVK